MTRLKFCHSLRTATWTRGTYRATVGLAIDPIMVTDDYRHARLRLRLDYEEMATSDAVTPAYRLNLHRLSISMA